MLKKVIPTFYNAPNPAQVRVRLHRISRLHAGGLFFIRL